MGLLQSAMIAIGVACCVFYIFDIFIYEMLKKYKYILR